ncbi:MAG TPA: 3'(2'),5'-bisphosphate nucleotidase CysQ [Pyrinomonadaceae bacterium]|jgi:3'(2'), 5'-bisphosphate nucleotidase|nr:3'(2'),5'-bisphosphate nucleotidase CysQ [Pyrinomonadaceae bacterium]HXC70083.1 3'(2'),5'-bisphosphate nucleotidase CysQ [Pyrinomonadaceae bacterium]
MSQKKSYEHELRVACELARAAGAAILEHYEGPLKIAQKNYDNDAEPVTQADTIANELIVNGLKREFPNDGILAEESVDTMHRLEKSRVWMVDPLDGTNGFIDGNGDFAVQIGLAEDGQCALGVVYQPLPGLLYRAIRDEGTWIERPQFEPARATVSQTRALYQMRLAASRSHRSPRMNQVVQRFGFKDEVRRGSVGIKVGLLIEQQCDVYIHLSSRTKQWDTCAPEVILTEAGGRITDLFGYPLNYNVPDVQNRNGLIASNGIAHDQIIETLAPLLNEFGRKRV